MRRAHLLAVTALATLAAPLPGLAGAAQAQAQAQTQTYEFDIPAQPLSRSVNQVASRANMQVLYAGDDSRGIDAPAIKGRMTADEALTRLLAGSGYTYRYSQPGVITLQRTSAEGNGEGERVTSAVRVEGTRSPYFGRAGQAAGVNGVNGSRDIGATEGTSSYTSGALSVASKAPQSIKDTPQSVSVLTAERMKDENVTDLYGAMDRLNGLSSVQGSTSVTKSFYSRGFEITSFQIDGGAPLNTQTAPGNGSPVSTGYFPIIDLSQYDRVELLRGAAGLFNGYGTPGGTINLARKRPLDHGQVIVEGKVGSWDFYRSMVDITSPLGLDGKLRGRLVGTYQENNFFYDIARDRRTLLYGVAELDLTPTTLLTAGFSLTDQDSVPSGTGLPRYFNGDDLHLPRSTCLCLSWGRFDLKTREVFVKVEQEIGSDWHANINVNRVIQHTTSKYVTPTGIPFVFADGTSQGELFGSYNDYATRQTSVDGSVAGVVHFLGDNQLFTFGANYANVDGAPQDTHLGLFSPRPLINPLTFDPNDPIYREPAPSPVTNRYLRNTLEQYGIYLNARLTFFHRLHLETGVRYSYYVSDYQLQQICTVTFGPCTGKKIGDPYPDQYQDVPRLWRRGDFSWPPKAALSYDIGKSTTLYGSYASIYADQSMLIDSSGGRLAPVRGATYEGGIKTERFGGKLNASLAFYYTKQSNFAVFDSSTKRSDIPAGTLCCYFPSNSYSRTSQGVEFELAGALTNNLSMSLGYTYSDSKIESTSASQNGTPLQSRVPKHILKLWTKYDFPKSGALNGLAISLGATAQSDTFVGGEVCTKLNPNDEHDCFSYDPPYWVTVSFTEPSRVVFESSVSYDISNKLQISANFVNLLDKTYYGTVGDIYGGNWYGTPRSVTLTLRGRW